jgi:hypothetical protein
MTGYAEVIQNKPDRAIAVDLPTIRPERMRQGQLVAT